ncbi:hypothetical protein ACMU_11335 [Actibacterium mucosum KCTC 23349]|uniref:MarR family transcriptional regulator n=1 Tax=Actibacterium mucosum KCTC 23349 TaxID=1454373 RepID=A0A037ZI41_9RHOB|nr:hypothetical protein ACMU_11335 [Actibacterium mucosum KCTC 23349]
MDTIRAFNRFYTARLGVLDRAYLDSGHSLGEVRVVFELAREPGLTARDLVAQLQVDEGQLSRSLKAMERNGLIIRKRSEADARRVELYLSPAGEELNAMCVQRSRAGIAAMFAQAGPGAVTQVAEALDGVQQVLGGRPEPVQFRDLAPGDAGWVLQRHAEHYCGNEGFDDSFETLVAGIIQDYLRDRDPAVERAWIAHRNDQRLGCIFCVRGPEAKQAKLRMFMVEPAARGQRLGLQLLNLCVDWARDKGFETMVLWTHESHRAACALYAQNGFVLMSSEPVRSFGLDLVEQSWMKTL